MPTQINGADAIETKIKIVSTTGFRAPFGISAPYGGGEPARTGVAECVFSSDVACGDFELTFTCACEGAYVWAWVWASAWVCCARARGEGEA